MHRFWDSIIEPVLEALQPRSIVEIGSDKGFNTRNLVEFCQRSDAKLHVVDPLPKYDVAAWQERYGEHVAFYSVLSLNAMLLIDRFDVVLIDGDHNWYTVLSELKLIEKRCKELSQPFPLVLMHDIGWPYGRRDLYYKPETIPDAYRRPFRQKGMHPESTELLEEGGLNQHLFNAIDENNSQSGVLTAIEDFLEDTEQQLKLVKIPGIHGLGILVPLHLEEQNEELTKLLQALDFSPVVERYVERVERVRLQTEIRREEDRVALRAKEAEAKELLQQIADKDRRLEALKISKEEERSQLEEQLEALESERQRKRQQLAKLRRKAKQVSQDRKTLVRWIQKLDNETSVLLDSRWWKTGQALGELHRKVMRRPSRPRAQDRLGMALSQFRDWKESRKRARVDAEDDEQKPSKVQSDGPAVGAPRPATSDEASPSTPTGGLPETKNLERGWRYRNRPPQGPKTKPKVSVISWDMAHNPVGRAHFIAGALSRKFDVEIVGARFPKYGTEIWEPLRDEKIPTIDFVGQKFPAHFTEMEALAKHIDGDIIFVSKPRLPSYELGILAKRFKNRPLILDVDDPELAFIGEDEGLTLDEVKALQQVRKREFLNPYSKLWTQYCESIIPCADHLTVSNAELQKKYGGTIFPHVKDERKFDPALYDRDSIRAKFGFTSEDKVVLFVGTPRPHKGVIETAEALEKIGNPRYKLCVIGTISNDYLNARLKQVKGDHVRLFKNQPYSDLPANLRIGDLVCLLQDPKNDVARYQMPAKFTDALAMEIPILATDVPPLANLASLGLVELLTDAPLDQKIDEIFSNYTLFKRKAVENREVFLKEYSYAAAAEKLDSVVLPLLGETPRVPEEFERLLQFHREMHQGK